jgi:hypothetical protein
MDAMQQTLQEIKDEVTKSNERYVKRPEFNSLERKFYAALTGLISLLITIIFFILR